MKQKFDSSLIKCVDWCQMIFREISKQNTSLSPAEIDRLIHWRQASENRINHYEGLSAVGILNRKIKSRKTFKN